MRRLVYLVASSVDGMIASPDGAFDHFPFGDHVAVQAREWPETLPAHLREALGADGPPVRFDTVVMGRRTYEPALAEGIADPYAPLETIVFSRSLEPREVDRLRITPDDPVETVRRLRGREGRDIWLCGGGQLASQLADEIDELVVKVNPMVTSDGIGLIPGPFAPRKLRLEACRQFDSGVVWLTYSRDR